MYKKNECARVLDQRRAALRTIAVVIVVIVVVVVYVNIISISKEGRKYLGKPS